MTAAPVVDPHQHFWDLEHNSYPWLNGDLRLNFRYGDYSALRRSYLPADYRRDSAGQGVVATVHVEAEWDPTNPLGETRWLHDLADRDGLPSAIVAQAWFDRDDIDDVLRGQAQFPLVRGIRQKPAAAPSPDTFRAGLPGSTADPAWRRGYALLARYGLHYELQTRYWHLGEAAALARDFPDIMLVVNHAGVPEDRSAAGLGVWREGMAALAAEPNVRVKISGLGLPGRAWTVADNRAVVLETIDLFGPARCMFASNYPVDSLVADFVTIFDGFREIVAGLDAAEQRRLFHDTAVETYRLS